MDPLPAGGFYYSSLHILGQDQYTLEICVFVRAQIVAFEVRDVAISAQIAIEACQNGVVHRAAAIRVDVAQSPGYPTTIAVVDKRIGNERTRRDRRNLEQ